MANEMRDRLLELIFQGDKKCSEQDCRDCKHHGNEFCGFEHIADYLIENGVVILPCRVGDSIFRVGNDEIWEWLIERIEIYEDEVVFIDDSENIFTEEYIGDNVFLNKSEAEQKLKEMRGE